MRSHRDHARHGLAALAIVHAGVLATAPAHAQEPAPRPRMSAAVGAGVSFDDAGLARTEAIPSFFATGGVGVDWRVGFELQAFASSAQGRFDGTPIDRLALDAVGVARPFAWKVALDDRRYAARVLRAAGLELGLGLERDGTTTNAGSRWGLHTRRARRASARAAGLCQRAAPASRRAPPVGLLHAGRADRRRRRQPRALRGVGDGLLRPP